MVFFKITPGLFAVATPTGGIHDDFLAWLRPLPLEKLDIVIADIPVGVHLFGGNGHLQNRSQSIRTQNHPVLRLLLALSVLRWLLPGRFHHQE